MQEALEAAVADLVFGPLLDVDDAVAVDTFLRSRNITEADAAALRSGELRRLLVYRSLVRGTLRDAVAVSLERTIRRLGPVFDEYFDAFLAGRGPRTQYLRDVTSELLDFCAPAWLMDARVPPYMIDLARHEALHIEIAAAPPAPGAAEPADLDLDAGLAFTEASRLVHYAYAVHRLAEDPSDTSPPAPMATDLFVYRSPEHEVRYLELSPLAAAIVSRLRAGLSLRESLTGAAAAASSPVDDALLNGTAQLLADLSERGALLGARAAAVSSRTP